MFAGPRLHIQILAYPRGRRVSSTGVRRFKVGDWVYFDPDRNRSVHANRIDIVRGIVTEVQEPFRGIQRCAIDWEDGYVDPYPPPANGMLSWDSVFLRLV